MTERREDGSTGDESPMDYAPGAVPGRGDSADVSTAQTDTATSDTEPVYESNPGPTTGDTSGEDPLGADDVR